MYLGLVLLDLSVKKDSIFLEAVSVAAFRLHSFEFTAFANPQNSYVWIQCMHEIWKSWLLRLQNMGAYLIDIYAGV